MDGEEDGRGVRRWGKYRTTAQQSYTSYRNNSTDHHRSLFRRMPIHCPISSAHLRCSSLSATPENQVLDSSPTQNETD